jgi:excisionase family DNA binding protein
MVSYNSPLMDPDQAAAYLGVEPATLAIWRSTRRYPLRYVKVGRHVRYRKSDLDAFLDKRTVTFLT